MTDLVRTGNDLFDKVLKVLAYLCDEVAELKSSAETRLYAPLSLFGAAADDDASSAAGELELALGRHLPLLQEVSNFCERCRDVMLNAVHQLAALYSGRERLYTAIYKHVSLVPIFQALGDLCLVLITIDAIVADNEALDEAWDKFKSAVTLVKGDPAAYGTDEEHADELYRLLVALDTTVLGDRGAFESCVTQDFEVADEETGEQLVPVRGNGIFMGELQARISSSLESLQAVIGTGMETDEGHGLVGVVGLYVLHRNLMPPSQTPDKTLYGRVWATQEAKPLVTLFGKVTWVADAFLKQHAPFPAKKLRPKDPAASRADAARKASEAFENRVGHIHRGMAAWLVQMDAVFALQLPPRVNPELLKSRGTLLVEGLVLAYQASHTVRNFMNLHLVSGSPIRARNIYPLAQALELLKVIENEFRRRNAVIAQAMPHILRGLAQDVLGTFRPVRQKLETARKLDPAKQECLAACKLLENVLQTTESMSKTRRTVVALGLRVALMKGSSAYSASGAVGRKMWMLDMLAEWQNRVRSVCDCSFLYWNRELLPSLLQSVYRRPEEAGRLPYLVAGFGDADNLLQSARNVPLDLFGGSGMEGLAAPTEDLVSEYRKFVLASIDEEVVRPTCTAIETDLRLAVHAVHLTSVAAHNPKGDQKRLPVARLLRLAPLRVFDTEIDVRRVVSHYLEKTFYNLTTVALHDWKTYGEMASLAADKYGLELVDNHLPMGSLDVGLDILAIIRNIAVFVRRYNYNLNQQFFIEKKPDRGAKHLTSVSLESIAASIRTHGIGMTATTVNFVYQFLRQKFHVFSQFLFDDYIRSYLSRERRWYKKNCHSKEVDNEYPYERAFEFTREIRKLGVENNMSFLDKFRLLITQIGNAIGYVRMVRSAGMHHCANSVKYVPDLGHLVPFELYAGEGGAVDARTGARTYASADGSTDDDGNGGDGDAAHAAGGAGGAEGAAESKSARDDASGARPPTEGLPTAARTRHAEGAKLSPTTVAAAKQLDDVITNLTDNFAEGADYLKVLVEAFSTQMMSEEQAHLKNFAVIIPALTINWVEASLFAKDRMDKSVKGREAYFTDDGFAIGLAYVLAILQQGAAFDALHWFDRVRRKYDDDYRELDARRDALARAPRRKKKKEKKHRRAVDDDDDDDELQELVFKLKRNQVMTREFNLLRFSLFGARIFFKDE